MKLCLLIILLGLLISVQAQWTQCDGPYGGGGLSLIAQNPATKTFFAGQIYGALYRLKANSNKWENLQDKFGSNQVISVAAIDNVVCVTTYPSGLYASYDDGDTWLLTGIILGNNSTLFADDSILIATGEKIFYTRDGRNFNNIPATSDSDFVAYTTIYDNRLFAWCIDYSNDNNLLIKYSDNWGQTWINANINSMPGFIYPSYPETPFIAYNDSLYFFPGLRYSSFQEIMEHHGPRNKA